MQLDDGTTESDYFLEGDQPEGELGGGGGTHPIIRCCLYINGFISQGGCYVNQHSGDPITISH